MASKSKTRRPKWSVSGILIVLLTLGLGTHCNRDRARNDVPKPPASSAVSASTSVTPSPVPVLISDGLPPQDLKEFYHVAEGSEFVPYCALKAYAKEHHLTLAQYFERYHLIPDEKGPTNPLGLPIGVTADKLRIIGFNCAACHVGRITAGPDSYIVVGAPSSFNIRLFYDELIPWLSVLTKDRQGLRNVVGCMLLGSKLDSSAMSTEDQVAANEVSEELAGTLERNDTDAGAATEVYEQLDGEESHGASSAVDGGLELDQAADRAATFSGKLKALPKEKRRHLVQLLRKEFEKQAGLLKARIEALKITEAVGKLNYTTPGPGRVDAFMTALNLMNPGTPQRPPANLDMYSPVSFPQLWDIAKLEWLHWDNNTNATLERNMGQALGLGALIATDPKDPAKVLGTTLQVPGLLELERIVKEITPPPWPFGGDLALKGAGEKVYADHCGRCHTPNADGTMPKLDPAENVDTDRRRITSFEQERYGRPLIALLRDQLVAVERASAKEQDRDKNPQWVTTGHYGARTLHGVWATSPYLHNNSVPTLADLLTPPDGRPKRFVADYSHYDTERVGIATSGKADIDSPEFDTSRPGNGNGGHLYGTDLNPEEKRSLLVFLKQY